MPPRFPPLSETDPYGMLLEGGQLTTDWVREAYMLGAFPMPEFDDWDCERLAWWAPDPRAILELDDFHISRRLLRRLRRGDWTATFNCNFSGVIQACAAPRDPDASADDQRKSTWLTPRMIRVYEELHREGDAHSVEIWRDDLLVGGVYGVAFGGAFSAESMFKRERDASKAALSFLTQRLRERGFTLLDIQQWSEHTGSLGAIEIPRRQFQERLQAALAIPAQFADHRPPVASLTSPSAADGVSSDNTRRNK
ncbi:leucyl/phenylalanyl-tRNA--protein transferase [Lignipirellula cremea]|uniref:Leucyl/phenylalanyl-tRNA--protein transferase n=1 Tax=Lignipirellula cremea TaxID=2528010 RepID=A0A518DSP3_9BACT|nr:leucyl/phenylalanyl-tRNA--protein transferase [Lignipirellula cremea]QDU94818.1 Leucyl/phenylalanyl-tRNA--protein transferase [Lignipirellula cremea]